MRSTTDLFDTRIREGGRRKTVVDIYYNNVKIAENIAVDRGSIRYDRKANIMASGNITIPDPNLVPNFVNDTLSPYGTEVAVKTGIVYPDGSEELIPMGIFILDTTSWDESDGIPSIEMYDRSMFFNRQEISYVESYSGRMCSEVIEYLIHRNLPAVYGSGISVTFAAEVGDGILPGGNLYTSSDHQNYWELLQQIATAMKGEIFFDRDGQVQVQPPPTLDTDTLIDDVVWEVDIGPRGVLSNARKSISRKETYNHVWVQGKANEAGVIPYHYALNGDPSSPTYYLGPFGGCGKRFDMQELTTNDQCRDVAEMKLKEFKRLSRTLDFTALPNPALEVGDLVRVWSLDGSFELGIVESLTFPLGEGLATGVCSSSRL